MHALQSLSPLRDAATPFVSRIFARKRGQRFVAMSCLAALLTTLFGLWVALSPGAMARGVRIDVGVEERPGDREHEAFIVFTHTDRDHARMVAARARLAGIDPTRADLEALRNRWPEAELVRRGEQSREQARQAVGWGLADGPCRPPHREQLRRLAAQLQNPHVLDPDPTAPSVQQDERTYPFACTETEMRDLAMRSRNNFIPQVQRYRSPLSTAWVLRIMAASVAGVLGFLLWVAAPLWCGGLVAQEVHDATLQPLTATSLSAWQLTLGLFAGPSLAIGLMCAPFVAVLAGMTVAVGRVAPLLASVLLAWICSLLLSLGAMLVGLWLGQRRSPGTVGVLLLGLLVGLFAGAVWMGGHVEHAPWGALAVAPPAAAVHMLRDAVLPDLAWRSADDALGADIGAAAAWAGAAAFVFLAFMAIQRWIARDNNGLLTRAEAGFGAFATVALATLALSDASRVGEKFALGAMLCAVPMLLLLMARVPTGDTPAPLRVIPVGALLTELAVAALGATLVFTIASAPSTVDRWSPLGVLHILWGVGMAGTVAIRFAAAPSSVWTRLLLAVTLFAAVVEGGIGTAVCHDSSNVIDALLPMGRKSGLLGLVQFVALLGLPWLLRTSLTKAVKALRWRVTRR